MVNKSIVPRSRNLPALPSQVKMNVSNSSPAMVPKSKLNGSQRSSSKKNNKQRKPEEVDALVKRKQTVDAAKATQPPANKEKPASSHHKEQRKRNTNNPVPVKARRAQTKRDIVSMTNALRDVQQDFQRGLNYTSGSSSSESDDSDGGKKVIKRKSHRRSNQTSTPSIKMAKPGPTSFPPLARSKKATNNRRRGDHADTEDRVYAGPTFMSEAPAPSALPMPPSLDSAAHSLPMPVPGQHFQSTNNRLPGLQRQSFELMDMLLPHHREQRQSVPHRLQTGHDMENDLAISEIQRSLRSMLKI